MREIIFRGKTSDGRWLYGDLVNRDNRPYIFNKDSFDSCDRYEVDPETVGQFTGLKDKNGIDIYEGDLLKRVVPASWYSDGAIGVIENVLNVEWDEREAGYFPFTEFYPSDIPESFREVIGNIFDNPELIED